MKSIFSVADTSIQIIATCGFLLVSQLAWAQPAQQFISGADIASKVEAYLNSQNMTSEPKIASDRQFISCSSDLSFLPLFGSFKTLEVRCPDEAGWKIAVRTNARPVEGMTSSAPVRKKTAKISRQKNVTSTAPKMAVIVKTSLKRGAIITAQDVELSTAGRWHADDIFTTMQDVIGRVAKQNLNVGKAVRASQLEHNWMIRKDQPVILTTKVGGVEVSSKGIALEDAQWGQLARFLNVSSQREIFGRVASEKKIIIGAKID